MKHLYKILMLTLAIVILFTLAACEPDVEVGEKAITIILVPIEGDTITFDVDTDTEYLGQLLDEMLEDELITITTEDSTYGRFITAIGSLNPATDQWIAIHSDETDPTLVAPDGEWTPALTISGKTYYSTQLGLDSMPIYDGRTYVFSIGGQ